MYVSGMRVDITVRDSGNSMLALSTTLCHCIHGPAMLGRELICPSMGNDTVGSSEGVLMKANCLVGVALRRLAVKCCPEKFLRDQEPPIQVQKKQHHLWGWCCHILWSRECFL